MAFFDAAASAAPSAASREVWMSSARVDRVSRPRGSVGLNGTGRVSGRARGRTRRGRPSGAGTGRNSSSSEATRSRASLPSARAMTRSWSPKSSPAAQTSRLFADPGRLPGRADRGRHQRHRARRVVHQREVAVRSERHESVARRVEPRQEQRRVAGGQGARVGAVRRHRPQVHGLIARVGAAAAEDDPAIAGRPGREPLRAALVGVRAGELHEPAPVGPDHPDVQVAVALALEHHARAVRRDATRRCRGRRRW